MGIPYIKQSGAGGVVTALPRAQATGATAAAPPSIDRAAPGWAARIPFHDPGYGGDRRGRSCHSALCDLLSFLGIPYTKQSGVRCINRNVLV
jgi:hypothetical protein